MNSTISSMFSRPIIVGVFVLFAMISHYGDLRNGSVVESPSNAVNCSSFDKERNTIIGRISPDIDKCGIDYSRDLYLSSLGGMLIESLIIARNIYINKTTTSTSVGCYSACIVIAAAGSIRYTCNTTLYGIHSASKPSATLAMITVMSVDQRIHRDFFKIVRETPFEEITIVDAIEAKRLGLVDSIVDCS